MCKGDIRGVGVKLFPPRIGLSQPQPINDYEQLVVSVIYSSDGVNARAPKAKAKAIGINTEAKAVVHKAKAYSKAKAHKVKAKDKVIN